MWNYFKHIDHEMIFDGYEYKGGTQDDDDFRHDLHVMIDSYVCSEEQNIIKKIVDKYGVFKALKEYVCEYGEFNVDEDLCFFKTYGDLAHFIIDDYIQDNFGFYTNYLKENNMTKTDTDTDTDTEE